jgi:uncharacterized cupredoxin-like copper-binding protein
MTDRRLWFVLLGIGLLATACGGGGEADLNATLRDDGITVAPTSLGAGPAVIEGTNDGTVTHEFEVFEVPDGVDANALPADGDAADASGMEVVDEVEDIAPGTSARVNLDLEPGTYAVICNLPGHYANGMHATFTVS